MEQKLYPSVCNKMILSTFKLHKEKNVSYHVLIMTVLTFKMRLKRANVGQVRVRG